MTGSSFCRRLLKTLTWSRTKKCARNNSSIDLALDCLATIIPVFREEGTALSVDCLIAMDLAHLTAGLDYVATNGIVLSTEKKVAIDTSLILLQNAERFQHVAFWGKIQGISADYYIAQGYSSDPFKRKSFMR